MSQKQQFCFSHINMSRVITEGNELLKGSSQCPYMSLSFVNIFPWIDLSMRHAVCWHFAHIQWTLQKVAENVQQLQFKRGSVSKSVFMLIFQLKWRHLLGIIFTGRVNRIFSVSDFFLLTKTENSEGRSSFWQTVIHTPVQLVGEVSN